MTVPFEIPVPRFKSPLMLYPILIDPDVLVPMSMVVGTLLAPLPILIAVICDPFPMFT